MGVPRCEILGKRRYHYIATARAFAMRIARDEGFYSYPDIGRAFGRDHTTVMSACRRVARMVARSEGPFEQYLACARAWDARVQREKIAADTAPLARPTERLRIGQVA